MMNQPNRTLIWSKYILILLVAGTCSLLAHEYGHCLVQKCFGYHPRISFRDGGRVDTYDASGNRVTEMPPAQKAMSSAGGPAVTLLLAACFTALYLKRRDSLPLFALAIANATLRLNMLVDGFNSDEGNISEILLNVTGNSIALLVPLTVWTLSVILSCILLGRQKFCPRSYWMIPVFTVLNAASIRLAVAGLDLGATTIGRMFA